MRYFFKHGPLCLNAVMQNTIILLFPFSQLHFLWVFRFFFFLEKIEIRIPDESVAFTERIEREEIHVLMKNIQSHPTEKREESITFINAGRVENSYPFRVSIEIFKVTEFILPLWVHSNKKLKFFVSIFLALNHFLLFSSRNPLI